MQNSNTFTAESLSSVKIAEIKNIAKSLSVDFNNKDSKQNIISAILTKIAETPADAQPVLPEVPLRFITVDKAVKEEFPVRTLLKAKSGQPVLVAAQHSVRGALLVTPKLAWHNERKTEIKTAIVYSVTYKGDNILRKNSDSPIVQALLDKAWDTLTKLALKDKEYAEILAAYVTNLTALPAAPVQPMLNAAPIQPLLNK